MPQIIEPWEDERQIYFVDRQPLIRYIYSVSTGVGQLGCSMRYLWFQKLDSPCLRKPPYHAFPSDLTHIGQWMSKQDKQRCGMDMARYRHENDGSCLLGSLGSVHSIHSSPCISRARQSRHTVSTLQPAPSILDTCVYNDGYKTVL